MLADVAHCVRQNSYPTYRYASCSTTVDATKLLFFFMVTDYE